MRTGSVRTDSSREFTAELSVEISLELANSTVERGTFLRDTRQRESTRTLIPPWGDVRFDDHHERSRLAYRRVEWLKVRAARHRRRLRARARPLSVMDWFLALSLAQLCFASAPF